MFLLERFPHAFLIAVEPDTENYELCKRNLAPYGTQVRVVNAAVWGDETAVCIDERPYRDGLEWSRRVRAVQPTERAGCVTRTIAQLKEQFNLATIDLLKVDIEGSERHVFSDSASEWLGSVGAIAIELHDAECQRAFSQAVARYEAVQSRASEITWWLRRAHAEG